MLGADKDAAEKELEDALRLELKLAEFALPREKRRNKTALYNPMPLKYVQEMYPEIPLVKYINDITLYEPANVDEDEIVNVAVPDFVTKLRDSDIDNLVFINICWFIQCYVIDVFYK